MPMTYARIDLSAIAHNVSALRQYLGPAVELMAVVKANAYGHGAVEVAQVALESGAAWLAVARVAEGVQLRLAGISAPILIMGYFLPIEAATVVDTRSYTHRQFGGDCSSPGRKRPAVAENHQDSCEGRHWHGAFWSTAR